MILSRQRKVRVAVPALDAFLRRVQSELGLESYEVTVCLVSDAEIAEMNKKFRNKPGPTDVLSFPAVQRRRPARLPSRRAPGPRTGKYRSLGDIAIAPAVARRYARRNGRALPEELEVLILHGVLHLLGYDHETDHGRMDRIEQKLRRRFRLA